MTNVRVLHDGCWSKPGGGARVAREIARALDAPVTVGRVGDRSFWDKSGIEYNIAFQEQLQSGLGGRLPGPARELRLGQLFRSLDFGEEIIISSGTAAKWIIPRYDQRHVHYCHVPPPRFYGRPQRSVLKWGIRTVGGMLDRYFASFVDGWIANSEWTRKRIERHYRSPADVIHPPIDTERFRWRPPNPDRYVAMVGRLEAMKRPDLVAEAFDTLDTQLVLVGDGPLRGECERYDGVTVYPDLPDWAVGLTVSRATAGIAFAEGEHCGLTPKEFHTAGKPVIVPDEPNLNNHVRDGETGVIVEASIEGLRRGVQRVLDREWDRETIQQAAAGWRTERFHEQIRAFVDAFDDEPETAPPEPTVMGHD